MVHAIRTLFLKYPYKYDALMNFLGDSLKNEGRFAFNKAIVDRLVRIPNFPLKSRQGVPGYAETWNYIRFIFKRLILVNANVHAAVVAALFRFEGVKSTPPMRRSIAVLLCHSFIDSDDESCNCFGRTK